MQRLILMFITVLLCAYLQAQTKAANYEYISGESMLVFQDGQVDTLILVKSENRFFYFEEFLDDSNLIKIKKVNAFLIADSIQVKQGVKFRYHDEFLVDDIFITGKVLGYNDSHFLLSYESNGEKQVAPYHLSQLAVKDLGRWQQGQNMDK